MALSQDDRIAFSKKIVEAPFLVDAINKSKASIQVEKAKLQKLDTAHANLVNSKTPLIDGYQSELTQLDGNTRSNLTEQDQQDAANFVLGNFLYPNDPNNPPPSTAPKIWTKTKPYARNKGVGKFYNESFGGPVTKENDLITAIQTAIMTIETTYQAIERVSGENCVSTGTCSIPMYTDQATCVANSGIWTPGPDLIATYPAVHTSLANLITQVNTLKTFLLAEVGTIYTTDSDNTRKTESLAAVNYINNTIIPAINVWLGLTDFNPSTGETTCTGFYSHDPTTLGSTKLQASDLLTFKNALIARQTFITTRQTQLNGYLGTMVQDLSTGDVSGSGLYFERWSFIQLRLNLLGGSLTGLKGFDRAQTAQDDQIANINNSKATYELILKCSALSAPATGTNYVSLKSSSGFSVGDTVYVMADDQQELMRTIQSIDGNRLLLGQPVPANYRDTQFARVYKDLS